MVLVSAPGKLMLTGEWAVLEVGNPAIVAAVNRRVFAEITEAEKITITLPEFGIDQVTGSWEDGIQWDSQEHEKLMFTKAAIEAVFNYLGEEKTFALKSWGKDTQIGGEKVGFGSSAAAVVAQIGGLLKFFGKDIDTPAMKEVIFKLAAIAHYTAQGKAGSAFDVAASTYGGVTMYARFDPVWLAEQMQAGVPLKDIVADRWPGLRIEPLPIPEGFQLLVAWTGKGKSTRDLMKQVAVFKEMKQEQYNQIYKEIGELVEQTITHWKAGDKSVIIKNLNTNQELLKRLTKEADVDIVIPALETLATIAQEAGVAGKLSGAGGGDCGIAVAFDTEANEEIIKGWKDAGLHPLDVTVDDTGVREE